MTADEYIRQKYGIPANATAYKSDCNGPGASMHFQLVHDLEGHTAIQAEIRRHDVGIMWTEILHTQEDWERAVKLVKTNPETR